MSLEGELQVSLRLRHGAIDGVRIRSTRPDLAHTLLQGRSRAEVQAAVPVMFSLCGRSQAAASRLACTAAAGEPGAGLMTESLALVAAETVRELACHTLLHWPRWLGEAPSQQAVAAARASMAWSPATATAPGAPEIALAAFGQPAADWLQMNTQPELRRWATRGQTPSARFIGHVIEAATAGVVVADDAAATTACLPRPDADWLAEVAAALDADPGFARAPVFRGAAAETGALARQQSDPLFSPGAAFAGSRPAARFVARLRELALLLDGQLPLGIGALPLGDGAGLGWVDNARGLLLHQVRLSQRRVTRYHLVAPTEWNFHPQGPLAAALQGAEVESGDAALALARQVVHSLDPCVACHVGLDDA